MKICRKQSYNRSTNIHMREHTRLLGIKHFRFVWIRQDIIWYRHIWVWLDSHFILPHKTQRHIPNCYPIKFDIRRTTTQKKPEAYIYKHARTITPHTHKKKKIVRKSHKCFPYSHHKKSNQTKPKQTKSENTYSNQSVWCCTFRWRIEKIYIYIVYIFGLLLVALFSLTFFVSTGKNQLWLDTSMFFNIAFLYLIPLTINRQKKRTKENTKKRYSKSYNNNNKNSLTGKKRIWNIEHHVLYCQKIFSKFTSEC